MPDASFTALGQATFEGADAIAAFRECAPREAFADFVAAVMSLILDCI